MPAPARHAARSPAAAAHARPSLYSTDPATLVAAWGLNDADSTCLYLEGGGFVSLGFVDAGDGWGYFWMPNLTLGDHRIWISNTGCKAPHWSTYNTIHVVSAPPKIGGG